MHALFVFFAAIAAFFSGLFPGSAIYEAPARSLSPPAEAHVIVGGDMMFDRAVREAALARGGDFLFSCLDPLFQTADLVAANLEGPITDNPSISVGSRVGSANNFVFTFPTSTAALLRRHDVALVNLGNNHIENFGIAGLRSTEHALDTAGVQWFGDPIDQTVAVVTVHGIRLAFINFNQFAESSTADITTTQIRSARAAGELPIVYTHWGDEYEPATEYEKELAHEFVDAGAVIVIGSHPHVVQESETYRGVPIYYSLGNMIFDQYWEPAVRNGLLLDITLTGSGVSAVRPIPIEIERSGRTCIATSTPA